MVKNLVTRIAVIIVSFALFIAVSIFVYQSIVASFITSQTANTITSLNRQITADVSYRLDSGYDRINLLFSETDDIEDLSSQQIDLYGTPILGFGKLQGNTYTINGATYTTKNEAISPTYINQNICFYNVSSEMTVTNHQGDAWEDIIVFKVDDNVAIIDTTEYLSSVIENGDKAIDNIFFIIEANGKIDYQTGAFHTHFFDTLRAYNHDEKINNLKEKIESFQSDDAFYTNIAYGSESYFVAFSPIAEQLFVIQMFANTNVENSMTGIIYPLLFLLILYAIILALSVVALYFHIVKKNDEIQLSKLSYRYNKVYVIKVSPRGRIISKNLIVRKEFPQFKSLDQLKTIELTDTFVKVIKSSQNFTVEVIIHEEEHYINFVSVKARFGYYLIGHDITEERNNFILYRTKALFDDLTTMPNDQVLSNDLKVKIEEARKEKKTTGATVNIGIQKFENFNTFFNSRMCDMVVRRVGEIFTTYVLKYDIKTYHLGNDYFVVLFNNINEIKPFCNEVHDFFKRPLEVEGNLLDIEMKFGVVFIEDVDSETTPERILENGKLILSKIKSTTGSFYGEYDLGMNKFLTKEKVMFEDLKKAIINKEFEMFLQAQYNNEEEKIVGFEALVRWNNPKYKYQSPGHYIKLAEENNMINKMGDIVIEKSLEIAKKLEDYDITISLNVSPIQIMQSGFVVNLVDLVKKFDVKPQKICIEITETFLMENFQTVIEKMKLLKQVGFGMHLDDFGTGWSSMAYLKELPFDTIKIDKDFVKFVNNDKYAKVIVSKIISMAKGLSLEVIAEGVENEADNLFLYKHGCNIIQGYLISKPVPFDEALELLQKYNSGQMKVKKGKNKGE